MSELIIIGGGASGLAAAVTAASLGVQDIVILEKLPRTGKKMLATGNGRCNLSHTGITDQDYTGSYPVGHILDKFGDVREFFENLGLYCHEDAQGRLYPHSNTAASVLDAFRQRILQDNIAEVCGQEVLSLQKKEYFQVQTAEKQYNSRNVIFAAGGYAAPKFGTDGSAWKLLKDLHIPMTPPHPILCPIRSDRDLVHLLKGVRVKGSVTLLDGETAVCTEYGEIQFTENALSGICVFDLSAKLPNRFTGHQLSVNCMPEEDTEATLAKLYACQTLKYRSTSEDMLTGLLQKSLDRAILKRCGIRADMPCSHMSGAQLHAIANVMHDFRFPITGLADFSQAQATAGGVHGSALDENLQVRAYPGLYVTGEAVDVHAKCGGYHLHWCWASGAAAASAVARKGEGT